MKGSQHLEVVKRSDADDDDDADADADDADDDDDADDADDDDDADADDDDVSYVIFGGTHQLLTLRQGSPPSFASVPTLMHDGSPSCEPRHQPKWNGSIIISLICNYPIRINNIMVDNK